MSTHIKNVVSNIIDNDIDTAADYLRIHIQEMVSKHLNEDHEMYMTSDQMEKHINKLHGLADDKDSFFKILSKYSGKEACTEKDFKECSQIITDKGKVHADKAIHKLEKLVGYKFEPKDLKENFGNVLTRALAGVPDNGAKIPNMYTTKNVNKLKKTLPKLKKSVYGIGGTPASLGVGGGSDAGGGDGGGGE